MREKLLKRDMPSSTPPEIRNGAQRIGDLMTALTFGEIKEITVDGQKIELSEIGIQPEAAFFCFPFSFCLPFPSR